MLFKSSGLYTDMYELTMAQGYFINGKEKENACFDYSFRSNPFEGGFVIFAGISDLLKVLEEFIFDDDDINYLRENGFKDEFLKYLSDFKINANIYAVKEGEVVFPHETVVRVDGNLIETQLLETIVLNYLNFQSLIATKAARIRIAAKDKVFSDFGLRRAQGLGGIQASKAAIIGGANSTSNVYAGANFDIPITGTQAHSWIQTFDNELNAFRKYAEVFPDKTILLVDTYDTLNSGVPNAIRVAKEMEVNGHRLIGVRLDSGDLAYLSKKARKMFDDEGLNYVQIFASNELDEYLIRSLFEQKAPIDGFGVGTNLITGRGDAALDGVYKLSMSSNTPRLKITDNISKANLPGVKKVERYYDSQGMFYADGISLTHEKPLVEIYHPFHSLKHCSVTNLKSELLLNKVMENGKNHIPNTTAKESAEYAKIRLKLLPEEHKRFENPHVYKVGISEDLMDLRNNLIRNFSSR